MEPKIKPLIDWLDGRKVTIASILQLADELDEKYGQSKMFDLVGAMTGAVGTVPLVMTSLAAAPFTGGVSLAAGLALSAGCATKIGTSLANKTFADKIMKKSKEMIDQDCERGKVIKDTMTQLCEVEIGIYLQLSHQIEETVKSDGTKMPKLSQSIFRRSKFEGKYGINDLVADAGATDLHRIPIVQQGLRAVQKQNFESIQKMLKMCLDNYRGADQGPAYVIREIERLAKQFGFSGLLTPQAVMKLVGYARYLGIITTASLPFQLKTLYDSAEALQNGSEHKIEHKMSRAIRQKAKEMEQECKEIEEHVHSIVTDLSNLVLLINYIKKKGCDDSVDTILNMILKEINKARHVTDILNELHLHNAGEALEDKVETFEATTINCEGIIGKPIKEITMWLWCAWKLRCGSIMFLQNTHFTHVPGLWTLFGVSINCFGGDTSCGVSVLLPLNFSGAITSYQEFEDKTDPESSWNGRCVVVNIEYKAKQFSLVNIIAPTETNDMSLFMRETTKFVKKHATAPRKIISSVDFAEEIPTMTVEIPNKVSTSLPIPIAVVKKFIPSQPVVDYLIKSQYLRGRDRDTSEAEIYVGSVCNSLNLSLPGEINWVHCGIPTLKQQIYKYQMIEFLRIGLTDLWPAKNSGFVEFSTVNEVVDRTVTATRTVHFYVSKHLVDNIRCCEFDHIPRILGFVDHSPLTFAVKNVY